MYSAYGKMVISRIVSALGGLVVTLPRDFASRLGIAPHMKVTFDVQDGCLHVIIWKRDSPNLKTQHRVRSYSENNLAIFLPSHVLRKLGWRHGMCVMVEHVDPPPMLEDLIVKLRVVPHVR